MKRLMTLALGCAVLAAASSYAAIEDRRSQAPDFHHPGDSRRQAVQVFSLADALKNGPVVLVFLSRGIPRRAAPSKPMSSPRPRTNSRPWAPTVIGVSHDPHR